MCERKEELLEQTQSIVIRVFNLFLYTIRNNAISWFVLILLCFCSILTLFVCARASVWLRLTEWAPLNALIFHKDDSLNVSMELDKYCATKVTHPLKHFDHFSWDFFFGLILKCSKSDQDGSQLVTFSCTVDLSAPFIVNCKRRENSIDRFETQSNRNKSNQANNLTANFLSKCSNFRRNSN